MAEKINVVRDELTKINNSKALIKRIFSRFSISKNKHRIKANPKRIARSFGFN